MRAPRTTRRLAAIIAVAAVGCGSESSPTEGPMSAAPASSLELDGAGDRDESQVRHRGMAKSARSAVAPAVVSKAVSADAPPPPPAPPGEMEETKGGGADAPADAPLTRAWFPETFLFQPAVLTDAQGQGQMSVRVPDRLTTWRVLALAHSRDGAQAGATTSFASLLPVSIDVVVPRFVVVGDRVALPLQLQNTTDAAVRRALTLRSDGATLEGVPTSVSVGPQASASVSATLVAKRPGTAAITAAIGDDAVVRSVPVLPAGQPRALEQGGTLASPRTFEFAFSADEAPIAGSGRVAARVYPGALAVLRQELGAATGRVSVDDDGALLVLSATAETLAARLGHTALATPGSAEQQGLIRLRRLAAQRLARHALSPSLPVATALGGGAAMHDEETLIGRTGGHLLSWLARQQRPDGTWGGGGGMTVQQLLVTTADALLPLQEAAKVAGASDNAKRRATQATLLAQGAFGRLLPQANDAYTAACVLMTGAVDDGQRQALAEVIAKAVTHTKDGSAFVAVTDVLNRNGSAPSSVEATARAILALKDMPEHDALRNELGAHVLAAYRGGGFGDGLTTRHALAAVLAVFKDPLPSEVKLTLSVGDKVVATDTLTGDRLKDTITMSAPLATLPATGVTITVAAEPPLPGLAATVVVDYAVAVPPLPPDAGVALERTTPERLRVGEPTALTLAALVPGGAPLEVELALPAGVDVVVRSLEQLRDNRVIDGFEANDGMVVLRAPSRAQGELWKATFQVVPTLAGALSERHVRLASSGREVFVPPTVWRIER